MQSHVDTGTSQTPPSICRGLSAYTFMQFSRRSGTITLPAWPTADHLGRTTQQAEKGSCAYAAGCPSESHLVGLHLGAAELHLLPLLSLDGRHVALQSLDACSPLAHRLGNGHTRMQGDAGPLHHLRMCRECIARSCTLRQHSASMSVRRATTTVHFSRSVWQMACSTQQSLEFAKHQTAPHLLEQAAVAILDKGEGAPSGTGTCCSADAVQIVLLQPEGFRLSTVPERFSGAERACKAPKMA